MIWARWASVMGVPMKWEIARIFVVGTGGSGFCAEAAPSGVIGFFIAVAPYSSFGILQLIVSVFDARTASAGRCRRHQPDNQRHSAADGSGWRGRGVTLGGLRSPGGNADHPEADVAAAVAGLAP